MKKSILISFAFIITALSTSFSQDYIIKKDGTKLEVKVLEISSTEVKYYNFTQPNGPLRVLGTHELTEIIYENGEFEKFDVKGPVKQNNDVVVGQEQKSTQKYSQFDMMGAGFAIDFLFGASQFKRNTNYYVVNDPYDPYSPYTFQNQNLIDNLFAFSLRISNKFYFDATPKWRTGIQISYIRIGGRISGGSTLNALIVSPINFGTANIIRLNDKFGLEANFIVGPTITISNGIDNSGYAGFSVNPEVKLRYKVFAVGIDYSRTSEFFDAPRHRLHQLSLSLGVKF